MTTPAHPEPGAWHPAAAPGPHAGAGAGVGAGAAINWAALHRTTRVAATVTTFAWPTKVALSTPPVLVLSWWAASGALFNGVIALGLGLPMAAAMIWWLRQVWAPGPDPRADRRAGQSDQAPPAAVLVGPMHPAMAYLYHQPPQWEIPAPPT